MNLRPEINAAVEEAISRTKHGDEEVDYLADLTVMNNEQGNPVLVTVIAVRMNALAQGEYITGGFIVHSTIPNADQIEPGMERTLADLRKQRIEHAREISQNHSGHAHQRPVLPGV